MLTHKQQILNLKDKFLKQRKYFLLFGKNKIKMNLNLFINRKHHTI